MLGLKRSFRLNKSTVNEQKVKIMNLSSKELRQPEQVTNSEQEADDIPVSPSIANALVIGCPGQRILRLTIKKKWFNMIKEGVKVEEYREIKPYWFMRLIFHPEKVMHYHGIISKGKINQYCVNRIIHNSFISYGFIPFDLVEFKNGYSVNSPKILVECKGIKVGFGNTQWGAEPNERYFTIKLGAVLG
jgi:hypothetical protein